MNTNNKILNSIHEMKVFFLLFIGSILSISPLIFEIQTTNASPAVLNSSAAATNNNVTTGTSARGQFEILESERIFL